MRRSDRTLNRRVDLPSGGYLIFDYAEAFTVIDVNTGRFVGSSSRLEDTITRNNIEAAREVMRQLRLRDIGGIIVIDFIDMAVAKNRAEVLKVLQAELENDRTKTYLVEISPLGLVEMTRQNVTEGVREIAHPDLPHLRRRGARALASRRWRSRPSGGCASSPDRRAAEAFLIKHERARSRRAAGGPGGDEAARAGARDRKALHGRGRSSGCRWTRSTWSARDRGSRSTATSCPSPTATRSALKIAEPHMYNITDGVARIDGGYPVVVGGAIGYVGQEHRVRIERASRTDAYATLLDAKTTAIQLEPEPEYSYEIPEIEREVGERLELEQRTKPRRTRRTPEKAKDGAAADGEAKAEEAQEQPAKKPAPRRRTRATAKPEAAAPAEAAAEEAPDEAAEGGDEAAAARKRRRGKRGGRGRSKAATAATADGVAADTAADVVAAEPGGESAADAAPKPKPRRRRTPAKAQAAEPKAEEPAPAPAAPAAVAEAPAAPPEPAPGGDGKKSGGILGRLLGS